MLVKVNYGMICTIVVFKGLYSGKLSDFFSKFACIIIFKENIRCKTPIGAPWGNTDSYDVTADGMTFSYDVMTPLHLRSHLPSVCVARILYTLLLLSVQHT